MGPQNVMAVSYTHLVRLVIGIGNDPLLPASTCNGVDVAPTATAPKLTVAGVRVTSPAAVPVPLKSTSNCPP